MIKLNMSLFDLAYLELIRERKKDKRVKITDLNILNRAIKIRKWLDNLERCKLLKRNRLGRFI